MKKLENVRFSHVNGVVGDTVKYNGFTIAYVREGKFVKYAYSLVCGDDQYDKKIGREVSTATLERNYDSMIGIDFSSTMDTDCRVGIMCIEEILDKSGIYDLVADHVTSQMTVMDLKHSTISHHLNVTVMSVLSPSLF